MHSSLTDFELEDLNGYINNHGSKLEIISIVDNYFTNAPIIFYYTKEMYYRLLAYRFLPKSLDRILYLDPDVLIINPIRKHMIWILRNICNAAAYRDIISIKKINKLRLRPYKIDATTFRSAANEFKATT